ncbi:hypothetical protein F2Q68_00021771 [Brassica cretica]|uniref:Uncharacterized protein n=1 Tax=Brassica cretica TaxID=69181 RepID=A0A8S9FSL9_BRACR|nr:hypothetical protein F2Q68_00021771 [Brassica cretica]
MSPLSLTAAADCSAMPDPYLRDLMLDLGYQENMLSEVMDFDHTFLWTATYWYPIENDRLNVSSQPHNSNRLFCYAGSLSKGSDVGLVYPENMLSEVAS